MSVQLQELEGRLHWAIWALELGMLPASDLSPLEEKKTAKGRHAATLYDTLQKHSRGERGAFRGSMAGCERDVQRLSSIALTYYTQVKVVGNHTDTAYRSLVWIIPCTYPLLILAGSFTGCSYACGVQWRCTRGTSSRLPERNS